VLFFSLSGCKRPGYVLPAMPLLALALASHLERRLPSFDAIGSLQDEHSQLAYGATMTVLILAIASCVLAAHQHLVGPLVAGTLGLLSSSALILIAWSNLKHRLHVSWLLCAATTFTVLLAGMHAILPGYARHFSMRGQVRPLATEGADASLPVACYPRGWDSVNFYLQREDVRVYTADERNQLLADLAAAPRTLLFVRTKRALEGLTAELRGDLEFVPLGRQGTVRVGVVQPRASQASEQMETASDP
jgi:hypothetical protein